MEIRRQLILTCLLGAELFLIWPTVVQAQFTFTTNSDGSINVSGYTGGGAVKIPDTFNNLPITTIGFSAFHLSGLSSVTMGTNVTSIGIEAFMSCSGLKSVTFGPRTTSIGNSAFSSCSVLKSVAIPDSVTNFGVDVFMFDSKLNNVTLGNGVPSLPDYTFDGCTSLTNVVIGSGGASFGNAVFTQCPLQAITVDPQNQFYCSVDGVFFNKQQTKLIVYPVGRGGKQLPSLKVSLSSEWMRFTIAPASRTSRFPTG
jgi:hypothetical protein